MAEGATERTPAPSRPVPWWRRALIVLLVTLSAVVAPLAAVTAWVHDGLLDESGYVDTVAPLSREPEIVDTVADLVTRKLFRLVDVRAEVSDALPSDAAFLAGPLTLALEDVTRSVTERFLASDAFQTLWRTANREAHALVRAAISDEAEGRTRRDGKVVLDLAPLLKEVRSRLGDRGISLFDEIPNGDLRLQFQLLDASQAESTQTAIRVLDRARIVLLVVVFALFGLALVVSTDRRRTAVAWGLALAGAMAVTALALTFARSLYLDAVTGPNFSRPAAGAAFDTIVRFLRTTIVGGFLLGVIVAGVAFAIGPARVATRLRATVQSGVRRLRSGVDAEPGAVTAFVAAHKVALRVVGGVVAFVVLIWWRSPTPRVLLALLVALGVWLVAVEVVARGARAGAPERES